MAVSNRITAILNFLIFLSSIPVIAAGIWLASKPDNECVQLLRWPVVVLGGLLLLVSLIGFVGAYCNRPGFLAVYLFCMALLILLLLILLVIAFTVTRPDGSHPVAGSQFQEYRLDGYSSWLRNHVTSSGSWQNVRTCLAVSDVCPKLDRQFSSAHQFFAADISPLQNWFHGICEGDMEMETPRHRKKKEFGMKMKMEMKMEMKKVRSNLGSGIRNRNGTMLFKESHPI
ncbi:tetraspanin-2-like isoform X2 [Cucurbita maxima]|uniref:Tetraspanin-2-like isoform X2 n=1 Tax=Cucurbita maxima TaxID=3661 RepID=A0A6J1IC23_CUCMA|nr:tetraspanin-2-like isoform X2 [Cucurbita maxima]